MSKQDKTVGRTDQRPTSSREVAELGQAEDGLRRDRMLLEAIHHAQTQFILADDPLGIFGEFLKSLLTLTDSEYGFVDEMFYTEDGRPYLTARAITDISWSEESRKMYKQFIDGTLNFDNLNSLYGVVMSTGKPLIANDAAHDPRRTGIPPGHPPLKSFLGLPLLSSSKEFVGMIGLANRPGGYTEEVLSYLEPMVVACANLIAARKNDQRRRDAEGELQQHKEHLEKLVEERTAELARQQYLLNALVDNIPDPVFFKDRDGRFIRVNQAMADDAGLGSPAELLGKTDDDIWSGDLSADTLKDERRILETGEPLINKEEQPIAKDGKPRWVLVTKMALHNEAGEIVGTFGVARDITQRKFHEQEIERINAALLTARDAAEQANRAKSDFLANMSHEIRTPMNAIIGMTDLVLDTSLDSTQRDYLTIVSESAESLLSVINQILDFSKIEAGKLELDSVDFDIREEVGDTLKSLGLRAHAKELELAWHVHSDVPRWLGGDPVRLRQMLVNLVGNAIKFTDEGEVMVDVQREEEHESRIQLHFSVCDTGPGIPEEKRDQIFSAFEQADTSTTRQHGGTGLGLAITSRIAEAMGGRLWVESTLGSGSTFHFTADFEPGRHQQSGRELPDLNGLPVLVVDDNETNRRILKEMLQSWGMAVETVEGGCAALALLQQTLADRRTLPLVISDVNMPEMDGFTLAEKLRSTASLRETVVIMLTSGGRHGDIERCDALKVSAHLMKPLKQSELLEAIILAVAPHSRAERVWADAAPEIDPYTLPPRRILLAEDGKANQKLAIGLLTKWGHEVHVPENGQRAVERWQNESFDVILMDVQMPVLDGLEATRSIRDLERERGGRIPIVAMTARAMKGDRERCLAAGMDDYVSKPVRKAELFRALGRFCMQSEESAAHTASPMIDWEGSLERLGGDRNLLREIADTARQEMLELLRQLEGAITVQDARTIQRLAHTVKGEAATLAAAITVNAAAAIEDAAANNDLESASRQMSVLRTAIDQLVRECEEFMLSQ